MQVTLSNQCFKGYSQEYDILNKYSVPYQQLMQTIEELLIRFHKQGIVIKDALDVGGGTGNFSNILCNTHPTYKLDFIEPSKQMMAKAKEKLGNFPVQYILDTIENHHLPGQYDCILCIHTLYLIEYPKQSLYKMINMLKPGGILILCDIGKKLNYWDWTFYYLISFVKNYGVLKAYEIFRNSSKFQKSNKAIIKGQIKNGWFHSLNKLVNLVSSELDILHAENCFRGYSNLVIGKKHK